MNFLTTFFKKFKRQKSVSITLHLSDVEAIEMGPERLKEYKPDGTQAIKSLEWILRCAESSISDSYLKDAVRYKEMFALCDFFRHQLYEQCPELFYFNDKGEKILI